jgi:predicted MFS family arabinose efflux permease
MSLDLTQAEALLGTDLLPTDVPLSRGTLWVMSAACGVTVASLYANQPLLDTFARSFHATPTAAAYVVTAGQVGYGVGIFFLVPLGDLIERRGLVLALTWTCAALLVAMATAPVLWVLIGVQLLLGAAAVSSQILIPLGIDLTPPQRRGDTVGTLMAGLLCGILLARTVAGYLGDHAGWRPTYAVLAVAMFALGFVLLACLPHRQPDQAMPYPRLMRSMLHLVRTQPPLWTASLVSGLSFAGFTAFWTVLSFLMHDRFGYGATAAGLFGLVGAAGALAAPLAGRLSDRRGPAFTVTLSLVASAVAFALMGLRATIPSLIVGVLLMDLGVQSIQVAEQSLVMALVPSARSRLNTVYMVVRFLGGAGGSAMGAAAWSRHGWGGVCGACVGLVAVAVAVHRFGPRPAIHGDATAGPTA